MDKRAKLFSPPQPHVKTGDPICVIEDYGNNGMARSGVIRSATSDYIRSSVKLAPVLNPLSRRTISLFYKVVISNRFWVSSQQKFLVETHKTLILFDGRCL